MPFAGKVAFVTNAGAGIGRAVALAFARQGAGVAVVGSAPAANDETVRLVAAQGGQAVAITCAITDEQQVQEALAQTITAFGRLDFALNNAGLHQHDAPTTDLPAAEWNGLVNSHLRGTFLCLKHEIPLILRQGGGAIVNTSSGTGLIGSRNNAAYYAAQHGIIGMTCSAALNYTSQRLRINALCPSSAEVPTLGCCTGGPGQARKQVGPAALSGPGSLPEAMAEAAVWLCSQGPSSVVSHTLVAAGGQVAVF